MNILLEKSEISILAAEILHEETYYAPSIHCSYYSCIQLMKHIVLNVFNEDESEFEDKQEQAGKPSHEFLINYIYKELNTLGGNCREFSTVINQLKRKRVEGDYKEIVMSPKDSKWAKEKSLEINNDLKTSFEV